MLPSSAAAARRLEWQLREDCRKGNPEGVRKAIRESQVNPNACDDLGQTPLWIASFHGRGDIVSFLISAGAKTEAATLKEGYTPLWVACQEGHADVVRLLLNAGANPNVRSKVDGATPMYIAAQKGMTDIVKALIAANANIDSTMSFGTTPLWIACQNGHADVVKLILTMPTPSKQKPNLEAQEVSSRATPLYIASQKGYSKIVELLLQHEAYVDSQTKEGATPIYIACQNGHFDVVRALLQFKANLTIKYKGSGTPLLIAMQRGHQDIVDLLQKSMRRTGSGDLPLPSPRGLEELVRSTSPPSLSPDPRSPPQVSTLSKSSIPNPAVQTTPTRSVPQPPPKFSPIQLKSPPSMPAPSQPIDRPSPQRSHPIAISPRSAGATSGEHRPAVSSSAPCVVSEANDNKNFAKLFVKVEGVNRRFSNFSANSLNDFASKIRDQLPSGHIPDAAQFELFDDDAQDYFLIEKWSVFKKDNNVVKVRLLQPSNGSDVSSEPDPFALDDVDCDLADADLSSGAAGLSSSLPTRGPRSAVVLSASPVITHSAARHASQPRLSPVVRFATPVKRTGSQPAQRSPVVGSPGNVGMLAKRAAVPSSPSRLRPTGGQIKPQWLDDMLGAQNELDSPLGEDGEAQLLAGIERYSISYTELQFGEKIGSGTFGDVFVGRWHGAVVAIKISRAITKKQRLDFLNEIRIMTSLTAHPHLITLMGICLNGEYPALVLEYADGGTLEKYVQQNSRTLPEAEIVRLAREIALGMRHLHRSNIIHRDLATRNVLLNGSSPPTCKISDFGLSRRWDSGRSMTDSTSGLPIRWMAPESLDTREYSFATDVWAYGMTLVEILTAKVPFAEIGDLDVGVQIRDTNILPTLPPHTPSIIASLCRACWDRNPAKRPSFDVISEVLLNYKPL